MATKVYIFWRGGVPGEDDELGLSYANYVNACNVIQWLVHEFKF